VRAPGRVNLIGGHTDYNEGFVLPLAVDRAAWLAAAPTDAQACRVYARDLEAAVSFSLDELPPADSTWADYPRGVAWALQERGLTPIGMAAVLTSDVPMGAGLSSSAAVEVAFAYAWQVLGGLDLSRRELALLCQRAENAYVGTQCGVMDQMASAMGSAGHAMLLDCRTLAMEPVPLPDDVAVVVADSGVRRELASSAYNVRRAQCEEAVAILRQHRPGVRALRDVTPDVLERLRDHLPTVIYRRARHVVTDNARVLQAAEALRRGDVATVGELMHACHISLRDDYEVSSPELNALVEAALAVEGCYGARLTGGGFGGCIAALVDEDGVRDFERHVSQRYEAAFRHRPETYPCRPAAGVSVFEAT
jgi:galactokinase